VRVYFRPTKPLNLERNMPTPLDSRQVAKRVLDFGQVDDFAISDGHYSVHYKQFGIVTIQPLRSLEDTSCIEVVPPEI